MTLLLKVPIKTWLVLTFCLHVAWELILSNLRVAYAVIMPTSYMKPGVIAIPLTAKSDAEIFILANAITLTPGTITIGVSKDKKHLFVHGMFIENEERFRKDIKEGFERKIMEIFA